MVFPNRSCVYFCDRRAISSRCGTAAGEMSAMKSSTSRRSFASALTTSASVLEAIFWVVSSQLIFSNTSENIYQSLQISSDIFCVMRIAQKLGPHMVQNLSSVPRLST